MTTLTWTAGGGKNDKASNRANWSGNALPVAGDILQVHATLTALAPITMTIQNNDLKGDHLSIGGPAGLYPGTTLTMNLQHAPVVASVAGTTLTTNLAQGSSLSLTNSSGPHVGLSPTTVNATGSNTFNLIDYGGAIKVNIAAHSTLTSTTVLNPGFSDMVAYLRGSVEVRGAAGSELRNVGNSQIMHGQSEIIMAPVSGTGNFILTMGAGSTLEHPSTLTFDGAVGAGQTIFDGGHLVLQDPSEFKGHILLQQGGDIGIIQFASVSAWNFSAGLLTTFMGPNFVVKNQLAITDTTGNGFTVQQGGTGVLTIGLNDPAHPVTSLPMHFG